MSEVIELERPINRMRLDAPRMLQTTKPDVRMNAHFGKIAEVTGRYFSEKFVLDESSMTCRVEKSRATVSTWKGW